MQKQILTVNQVIVYIFPASLAVSMDMMADEKRLVLANGYTSKVPLIHFCQLHDEWAFLQPLEGNKLDPCVTAWRRAAISALHCDGSKNYTFIV